MNQINEEKLNEWKYLIDEKKRNKLKLNDFCKEKNITPAQYYYYHALLNRTKKITDKKEVSQITPVKIINSNIQEQTVIRFILPNSLQCFLPRGMPLSEIKAMLEALMSC